MARILIIDDDEEICRSLSAFLRINGHQAAHALTLADGLTMIAHDAFDIVFLDVLFPEGNGIEALPSIVAASSRPEVIMMTGLVEPEGARTAMKRGAWDYVKKGGSLTDLSLALTRALEYREKKLAAHASKEFRREGIVGDSPQLLRCLELAAEAAKHDAAVLLTGETGTGKELFARAIHENSSRSSGHLVVVDCTALPETLVPGMLFGHAKGAFTGAGTHHDGLVKEADGGTLLLDEVGELPLAMQKTFLRVLQEKRFRPIGGNREIASDFRLIASTNRDLGEMADKGEFRRDLLYRLQSLTIELPPLRERKGDIQALALHLISRICDRFRLERMGCSPEFLFTLVRYDWPGNIRELVRSIEHAVSAAAGEGVLYRNHLPQDLHAHLVRGVAGQGVARAPSQSESQDELPTLREARQEAVDDAERKYLHRLLHETGSDIARACRIAGLSRSRLYALLQRHQVH